jgi:hypothetical protein
MNPEEKELLQKVHELSQENSRILHGIRRSHRWSTIFRVVYWIIIIGASIAGYYYVQPYINAAINAYKGIQTGINNVNSLVK